MEPLQAPYDFLTREVVVFHERQSPRLRSPLLRTRQTGDVDHDNCSLPWDFCRGGRFPCLCLGPVPERPEQDMANSEHIDKLEPWPG